MIKVKNSLFGNFYYNYDSNELLHLKSLEIFITTIFLLSHVLLRMDNGNRVLKHLLELIYAHVL